MLSLKILICNDDGINSNGIYCLAKSLIKLGEVKIVAPEINQSAIGHAITMHKPLRCKKVKFFDLDIDAWWVNGTPADCIKIGIESILDYRPDLIVSGINRGENLGTDVLYSGTVSAAIEGCIFGVTSIAVSYEDHLEEDFTFAGEVAKKIIEQIQNHEIPMDTVLNINIPKCSSMEELKGIKITKLGVKKYKNNFELRTDPRGNDYYWLAGELIKTGIHEESDIFAVKNKFISITPLYIDLTHKGFIKKLEDWKLKV